MADLEHMGLAIVSTFAWSGMEPLRVVVHNEDGSWQFLCNTTAEPRYLLSMHAEHAFERFAADLGGSAASLQPGYAAIRESPADSWTVERDEA